jgi:O-antigen ligase
MDARSPRGSSLYWLMYSLMRDRRGRVAGVVLVSTLSGIALAAIGQQSLSLMMAIVGAAPLALLFLTGQEVLLAGILPLIVIFIDHYQLVGLPLRVPIVGGALGGALLIALFVFQSDTRPWRRIPGLWLWVALLAITGIAIPRGPLTHTSAYFITVFLGPFIMYVLGTQVARNNRALVYLIAMASGVAVFIALHSIIQGTTGVFLFATPRLVDYLGSRYGFHLAGFNVNRAGSFLENPDWNGAYLAFSFFPLVGLVLSSKRLVERIVAGVGAGIVLIGLLFTFTTASWLALSVGVIILLWRVIPRQYAKRALITMGIAILGLSIIFGYQVRLLLKHATSSQGLTLRIGVWETALRVIAAHPLLGIGMSQITYLTVSQGYRVPWQTSLVGHPHDSYLELAAFVGIPALLVFLALLITVFHRVARNWRSASPSIQPIIGGVFTALIVLSVNSIAINAWTLPVIASIAWFMAGAASSRLRDEGDRRQFDTGVSETGRPG